jgi:hypothetical protein
MLEISWGLVASILVALILFFGLRALVVIAWAHFEAGRKLKDVERQYDLETERILKAHK